MNIEGLDYNTQREKLILPEYGREIQCMVDYAVGLPEKDERTRCAKAIVEIMKRMVPRDRGNADYEQKMWDHLALMSDFKLDIDWPFDISDARRMKTKPEPMPYPMKEIPVRHYGRMVFDIFSISTFTLSRRQSPLSLNPLGVILNSRSSGIGTPLTGYG